MLAVRHDGTRTDEGGKSLASQALHKQHSPQPKERRRPAGTGYMRIHERADGAFMIRCGAVVKGVLLYACRCAGECVGATTCLPAAGLPVHALPYAMSRPALM
jgi:hypothetical protein